MAPAQMALPVDRRNGASASRPAPNSAVTPVLDVETDPAPVDLAPVLDGVALGTTPVLDAPPVGVEQVVVADAVEHAAQVGSGDGRSTVLVQRVTTGAVLAVALVAAVASYEHMRALADAAGEGWRSWLLPISVDGLAVAASMTMLVRRRAGERAGALAWAALLLGLGASLAANVAAAEPTVQGRLVAAWPPIGLLLSYELLMQQIKARGGPGLETVRPGASNPSDGGSER